MATYKLTYFNVEGRAEVLRFIFAHAGVAYEDNRVPWEEWAQLKPTTPTGSLPMLEVDGKILTGNRPIAEYLAITFGLAGSNPFENAQLGGIVDYLLDFLQKLESWTYEKDPERKATLEKVVTTETIPKCCGKFNQWIDENTSDGNWIFGSKATYVDLYLYTSTDYISKMDPNFATNFPAIAKNREAVAALPGIAKWLKERPPPPQPKQ